MYIGADYYPEHWPEERWAEDARLMKAAHFTITRMAEFSWVKMEPHEGAYHFDWLDRAIAVLGTQGVKVILCTPTATMPKWLYDKYPDSVNVGKDGRREPFGNRQASCFSSGSYRLMSERITRAMAEHFRDNPNVIGWQLDNELNGPNCYCQTCESAFRDFLREKYGTVERMNEVHGNIFWSQSYGDWGETHLPRHKSSNPSLDLDYKRFHSANVISFAKGQADILRGVNPKWFITHNMMNFAERVDYHQFGKILDFVAEDYYYNYCGLWKNRANDAMHGAACLDFIRSVKHKGFWIMENSAGATGWETFGRNLRPGELRRMTWQNIAHGAEAQIWFRWRTSRYGTEQYWHGLLGHDGIPARRYAEAADTAGELQRLAPEIADTAVVSSVAVMHDYQDRWALSLQRNSEDFSPVRAACLYRHAFAGQGVNVDFVNPQDDFSGYKVLLLTAKYVMTAEMAARLEAFVNDGGVLVVTCRSGVKDEYNIPHEMTLPGHLRRLCGVRVEEYEALCGVRVDGYEPEENSCTYKVKMGNESFTGAVLADWIIPETAQALAVYDESGLTDYAALTVNSFGKGRVYYAGIESEEMIRALTGRIAAESGLPAYDPLPLGIELCTRENDQKEIVFLMNHSDNDFSVELSGFDLLAGENVVSVKVPANGVAVVKKEKRG